MDEIVNVEAVTREFPLNHDGRQNLVSALTEASLRVEAGEFLAISGPSGSGKTTLLNLIGCIDRPTSGRIQVDGVDTSSLSAGSLAVLRRKKIGFVFQTFNLIPVFTAAENVEYPLLIQGVSARERAARDASNGDVARTNYAADYAPVYLRTEKAGGEDCYVLSLTAKRKGATYQQIVYWMRVEDARPVRAEIHLTSGKLIKSASFDEFTTVSGHPQLHRMTLYDEIRHNSHSVLEYSGIAPRDLPDKLFYQGRTDRF